MAQNSILKLLTFIIIHIHHHIKLPDDSNKTASLHTTIHIKQNMVVELGAQNYATYDGFVNGANGAFKTSTSYHNKIMVWILFPNKKIGLLVREKSTQLYTNNIQSNWTPIEQNIKYIKIGKIQTYIITRNQFFFELVVARTIHQSQGLSLDELAFDPTNVKKKDYHILFFLTFKQKNDYTC
jgi:hypothetical protein